MPEHTPCFRQMEVGSQMKGKKKDINVLRGKEKLYSAFFLPTRMPTGYRQKKGDLSRWRSADIVGKKNQGKSMFIEGEKILNHTVLYPKRILLQCTLVNRKEAQCRYTRPASTIQRSREQAYEKKRILMFKGEITPTHDLHTPQNARVTQTKKRTSRWWSVDVERKEKKQGKSMFREEGTKYSPTHYCTPKGFSCSGPRQEEENNAGTHALLQSNGGQERRCREKGGIQC